MMKQVEQGVGKPCCSTAYPAASLGMLKEET